MRIRILVREISRKIGKGNRCGTKNIKNGNSDALLDAYLK
jgi:hypothetical protein